MFFRSENGYCSGSGINLEKQESPAIDVSADKARAADRAPLCLAADKACRAVTQNCCRQWAGRGPLLSLGWWEGAGRVGALIRKERRHWGLSLCGKGQGAWDGCRVVALPVFNLLLICI